MSNKKLIAGCRLWDKLTERLNDGEFTIPKELRSYNLQGDSAYSEIDYKPLKCMIDGDVAEVTVGDAPEHKTHIDLRNKTLEYHDPDTSTNRGVHALFKSVGLKCRILENRGVACDNVTQSKVLPLFKALALVPSMDRRMEHCRRQDLTATFCIGKELEFFRSVSGGS